MTTAPTPPAARRHRPPRCPSCGWHLVALSYQVVYDNPLRLWELVCPNPNKPDQHFPRCDQPENSINGFRTVSPKEAAYR